jgi:hypothetical protein
VILTRPVARSSRLARRFAQQHEQPQGVNRASAIQHNGALCKQPPVTALALRLVSSALHFVTRPTGVHNVRYVLRPKRLRPQPMRGQAVASAVGKDKNMCSHGLRRRRRSSSQCAIAQA